MVVEKLLHFSPPGWFAVPAPVLQRIIPHSGRKARFFGRNEHLGVSIWHLGMRRGDSGKWGCFCLTGGGADCIGAF